MNPVRTVKADTIAEYRNTAEFRSRNENNKNPLTIDELRALLSELAKRDPDFALWCLLMYECGLRMGKAFGLQWGDIWPSKTEQDVQRHVHIRRSRQGNRVGLPKSGRTRKVRLSQRLRGVLLERRMQLGRPGDEQFVIVSAWPKPYRKQLRQDHSAREEHPGQRTDPSDRGGRRPPPGRGTLAPEKKTPRPSVGAL